MIDYIGVDENSVKYKFSIFHRLYTGFAQSMMRFDIISAVKIWIIKIYQSISFSL